MDNINELIADAIRQHNHDHTATPDIGECENPMCRLANAAYVESLRYELDIKVQQEVNLMLARELWTLKSDNQRLAGRINNVRLEVSHGNLEYINMALQRIVIELGGKL